MSFSTILKRSALLGLLFVPLALLAQKQPVSQVMYRTIQEKGVDAAIKQFKDLQKNKPDAYDFSEQDLNSLGYRLVQEDNLKAATTIFKFNVEMNPKSPNSYDSLGEAYLRNGKWQQAKEHYEKALALLATAQMDDNTRQALQKNAEAKLAYLKKPDSYKASTAPVDFLDNNKAYPYGRLHPDAPPETEHWGRLAGEWECSIEALLPSGNWVQGGKATWIWKYILDGFAVQDLWFQKWIDLPQSVASINRDMSGTNIRMYLPAENCWEAVWFANGRNITSRFSATSGPEQIVMTGEGAPGLTRITFHDITKNSFEWKSETSQDEGETWTENVRIHCKRVK